MGAKKSPRHKMMASAPGCHGQSTVVLVPTLHPSCALQARNQSFETRCKLRQNGGANQGFHPHALRIHASARIHCALMHVYRITDSCSARSLYICIPWIQPTFENRVTPVTFTSSEYYYYLLYRSSRYPELRFTCSIYVPVAAWY